MDSDTFGIPTKDCSSTFSPQFDVFNSDVEIKNVAKKGRGVFATADLEQGNLVIIGKPLKVTQIRTMTSLQVGYDDHAELDEPACVVNHSCNPNLGIKNNKYGGYSFYALCNIPEGTELTWDYNTTEYVSIAVPECHCGADNCRKKTPGFKYLEEELRAKFGEHIADYLKND